MERYVPAYRWSRRWKTTSLWGDKRKAEPGMEKIVLDCRIEKDFNFLNRKIVFKRVLINVDRKINIFKLIISYGKSNHLEESFWDVGHV